MKRNFFVKSCFFLAVSGSILLSACSTGSGSSSSPESAATSPKRVSISGLEASEYFGYSLAIYDNTAVVGTKVGSAYILTKTSSGMWQQGVELTSGATTTDYFGCSVAAYEDTIVIGANDDGDAVMDGAAFVFTKSGDSWVQKAILTGSDTTGGDYFGTSVGIYDDTIVVGAYGDDDNGSYSGSAYVFTKNSDDTWSQAAKLTASDGAASDRFGVAVAIYDGTIAVSSFYDDDNGEKNSGSVYVFTDTSGTWSQSEKLTAEDDASAYAQFGNPISIYGDTMAIGAKNSDSAYIFTKSNGSWSREAKLVPTNGTVSDFGRSICLYNDSLIVGACTDSTSNPGSIYLFTRSGNNWNQDAYFTESAGKFAFSVALYDGSALIGASGDDEAAQDAGAVFYYNE